MHLTNIKNINTVYPLINNNLTILSRDMIILQNKKCSTAVDGSTMSKLFNLILIRFSDIVLTTNR